MKKVFKIALCAVLESILADLFIQNNSVFIGAIIFIAVYVVLTLLIRIVK